MSELDLAAAPARPFPKAGERRFGRVNTLGVWTLYRKEVQRFTKISVQTILAPMLNAVLFLAIFKLALGGTRNPVHGVAFADFLAPGLVMAAILQNAFANSSSSLLGAKVQGNYVDFLMPPLSPLELSFCFVMGGATRGIVVALAAGLAMVPFTQFHITHLWAVLFFAAAGSTLLSVIGVIAGIWAEKFDHMATVQNFIILPLSLLSGTFYSVDQALTGAWRAASHLNPFFYLIDGFRYGFIGAADSDLGVGVAVALGLIAALWWIAYRLLKSGYRLKA
ncbi:MAG: ABC transporter permease [Alphaproteobacteria bacterium]|nr:ABC transporter permease [Alphaproteobacteria bacterium]